MTREDAKRAVGRAAVDQYVKSGMKIGMGTGSTAVWAIRRIGELIQTGELHDIIGVPTSSQSEQECQSLGIPLRTMNDPEVGGTLDVTFDGADEIDPDLALIKGGGAALLVEKVVAYASRTMVVVADSGKLVENLGIRFPVPVEVLPAARVPVLSALTALGGKPEVRQAERKMGAVITDNGNIVVDVYFSEPFDPGEMERDLSLIPGVLGNGVFSRIRPQVLIGRPDGSVEQYTGA
jgi:ribose 5-phosphate isomerase A